MADITKELNSRRIKDETFFDESLAEVKPEVESKLKPEMKPVATVDLGVIGQLRQFREIFDEADKDEDGLLNNHELGKIGLIT